MGYDVHITRREHWWNEQGTDISAQEWEAAVAADPDLVMFPMPEGGWRGEPGPGPTALKANSVEH